MPANGCQMVFTTGTLEGGAQYCELELVQPPKLKILHCPCG